MPRRATPASPSRPPAPEPTLAPPAMAPLSPHWAFVGQLREGTALTPAQISGRVDHLISGQGALFASLDELIVFMVQVLTPRRRPSRAQPSSPTAAVPAPVSPPGSGRTRRPKPGGIQPI
jgi:hypothetical protein